MKTMILSMLLLSSTAFAAAPATMSNACAEKVLNEIGEGSVQMSAKDIVKELKKDWKANPTKATAHYDDCGPSDFFYITIKKDSCEVIELGNGDSDGECN